MEEKELRIGIIGSPGVGISTAEIISSMIVGAQNQEIVIDKKEDTTMHDTSFIVERIHKDQEIFIDRNPRGQTKDIQGVWLPRNRKHRYAYIIDKRLICLLKEEKRPTIENTNNYECCNGTNRVLDKRFNVSYSCPKCSCITRL